MNTIIKRALEAKYENMDDTEHIIDNMLVIINKFDRIEDKCEIAELLLGERVVKKTKEESSPTAGWTEANAQSGCLPKL